MFISILAGAPRRVCDGNIANVNYGTFIRFQSLVGVRECYQRVGVVSRTFAGG